MTVEEVIKELRKICKEREKSCNHVCREIEKVIEALKQLECEKVQHGKWIHTDYYDCHHTPIYECSNCHKEVADNYIKYHKYCLHCGAKMDLGDDNDS